MPVWLIILILFLLILALPVGADAAFGGDGASLRLKLGPFRRTLLPAPPKRKKEKPETAEEPEEKAEKKSKGKRSLTLDDLLTLAGIALDTLRAFRLRLSVDRLVLHWTAAAADPYDAVQQYGRVNAALGVLAGKAHNALKIREEDVQTDLDLTAERPVISGRLILSIQIWEILIIGLGALCKALRWLMKKKRRERAAAAAEERSNEDGELEHQQSDGCDDAEDP